MALLAAFLLYALDTTIVATIQPAIVGTYGRVNLVPWLAASFALASAASTLPWSKAFGTFSAKKLFLGGTALFLGASALCGGAPNIQAFLVGRAAAGVGGTGMYMGILTLLSVNTSEAERPRYLSLTGFWWGIGTVLGPVIGGAFAESSATWRCRFSATHPGMDHGLLTGYPRGILPQSHRRGRCRSRLPSDPARLPSDRKSTRLNSSHSGESRMPSSA